MALTCKFCRQPQKQHARCKYCEAFIHNHHDPDQASYTNTQYKADLCIYCALKRDPHNQDLQQRIEEMKIIQHAKTHERRLLDN